MLKGAFIRVIRVLECNEHESNEAGESRMQTCHMFVMRETLVPIFFSNQHWRLLVEGYLVSTAWHGFGSRMWNMICDVSVNTLNKQAIRDGSSAWEWGWG
jgi:hypothetical protein